MKKVKTIAQYRVLQFIEKNFYPDRIFIQILNPSSLMITDDQGEMIIFSWDGKEVVQSCI